MEEQFVTYDLAVKLRDLGLNLERHTSFAYFSPEGKLNLNQYSVWVDGGIIIYAPLWQQAFQWLMDENVPHEFNLEFDSTGWILLDDNENLYYDNEEALEKLIEIRIKKK